MSIPMVTWVYMYFSILKCFEISWYCRNVIAANIRSDDWLSVMIVCHLQMLYVVMRCLFGV